MRILAEDGAPDVTVLHCFSGDLAMARECVQRGYHLSFAGTVTFKSAAGLREALAHRDPARSTSPRRGTRTRPSTPVSTLPTVRLAGI